MVKEKLPGLQEERLRGNKREAIHFCVTLGSVIINNYSSTEEWVILRLKLLMVSATF